MKKRILAAICALACACTMSSPVYAKDLTSTTDLSTQQLDPSVMQTMSDTGNYNITVRSNTSNVSYADFAMITGTLSATNTSDTCTITVPETAALVMYSGASYPSSNVSIELKSQAGTSVATQYISSSTLGISEDVSDGILVEPGTYTLTYTASGTIQDSVTYATSIVGYAASTAQTATLGARYIGYHKSGDVVYKKITVKKAGLLAVCGAEYGSGFGEYLMTQGTKLYTYSEYLTLCNSKKKAITGKTSTSSTNEYVNYYAVKAGTYYVKIDASSSGYYCFGADFLAGGTTTNTSKAKAQKLSNKYQSTLLPIGGSTKTRWYKVTLKKKKKLNIYYDFYGTDGAIRLSVYNSKGKELTYASSIYTGRSGKLSTKTKYPKGTYYIKVTKPSSSAYTMTGMLRLKAN